MNKKMKLLGERIVKEASRDSFGALLGEVPTEVEIPFGLWCELVKLLNPY